MGDNARYAEFEFTVVELYDWGVLHAELLDALGKRHEGTDIDSGGSEDRTSEKDGKGLAEIVVSILEPAKFAKIEKLSKKGKVDPPYYAKLYDAFSEIT